MLRMYIECSHCSYLSHYFFVCLLFFLGALGHPSRSLRQAKPWQVGEREGDEETEGRWDQPFGCGPCGMGPGGTPPFVVMFVDLLINHI